MKVLALIPARGGSKGIPRKNIKILGGKPLLYYTLESALQSKLIDTIMVSTEDVEIAEIAKSLGAQVPFMRPQELAQDNTSSLDVIKHVINSYEVLGIKFDIICLLQPTSPYRPLGAIDRSIELLLNSEADSVISIKPIPHEFNPHWTFKLSNEGLLSISTGECKIISRRQELPPAFHRDGAIYISRISTIREKDSIYGDVILGYDMKSPYYLNIDTRKDWEYAEELFKMIKSNKL